MPPAPGPSAPRIPPLPASSEQLPLNIFRTVGRNEALSKGFLALGSHLLFGGVLPERERELVILRVGWRAASEYEFGQHTALGVKAGLSEPEIGRCATEGTGGWGAGDAALVAMVDELCADDVVSAPVWELLSARWSPEQLLELLALAGYYRLVSGLLNSVGVALEPQTAGWPAGVEVGRRAPRDLP